MKKNIIINAVSKHFTGVWVKNQENPKLEGFRDTAEQCQRNQNYWVWGLINGSFCILMSLVLLTLNFTEQEGNGFFWIPAVIGMIVLFGNTFLKLGENQKNLLKSWKPVRRRLKKYGVIQTSFKILKKDKADYIGDNEVRNVLVVAFDSSMKSLYAKLRKAEQEGFPKKEEKINSQIEDLKNLTSEMGLRMEYFEEGIPSGGERLRSVTQKFSS